MNRKVFSVFFLGVSVWLGVVSASAALAATDLQAGQKIEQQPEVLVANTIPERQTIEYQFQITYDQQEWSKAKIVLLDGAPATLTMHDEQGKPQYRVKLHGKVAKHKGKDVAQIQHTVQRHDGLNWIDLAEPQLGFKPEHPASMQLFTDGETKALALTGEVKLAVASAEQIQRALKTDCDQTLEATEGGQSPLSSQSCGNFQCANGQWNTCCGAVSCCNCWNCCYAP